VLATEHGFVCYAHAALAAAARGHEWPQGRGCFPSVQRMASCVACLATHGMSAQLVDAVPLLLDLVESSVDAEAPALTALKQLAVVPSVFKVIESRRGFLQLLRTLRSSEASSLAAHLQRMHSTPIVWTSGLCPLSRAVKLMAAQCAESTDQAEWHNAVAASKKDPLEIMRHLEGWDLDTAYARKLAPASWLWGNSIPEVTLALCFGAFKSLVEGRQRRAAVLVNEVSMLAGHSTVLRHGGTVQHGTSVLSYLSQKWGRHDLSGKFWCGQSDNPEEADVMMEVSLRIEWFEQLHRVILHGLVFPQLFPHKDASESDIWAEVDQAWREAKELLLDLEKDLAHHPRRWLCAGRLTIADLVAAAVLSTGDLLGQDLSRYPFIHAYERELRSLPGYGEAFAEHKKAVAAARGKVNVQRAIIV